MSPAPTSTSTPPAPQSSALPPSADSSHPLQSSTSEPPTSTLKVKPQRKPLLRLELRDLSSEGSRAFLRLLHASSALEDAVDTVLRLLYTDLETICIPPTRSITLVLRSMGGVAYTTGLDIDDDHKEIHFNTDYISHVSESRQKEEMLGVIVHEMVHCWQHNGLGTAPGGLIEGIADWVRLKAGYAPPHWRRRADSEWDAGYERTGYFLEWLEKEHGGDIVRRINDGLRGCKYDSNKFWHTCCGRGVDSLWEEYKTSLGHECEDNKGKAKDSEDQSQEQQPDESTSNQEEHSENKKDEMHEDHRTPREKARRGGRMHVPVRPGTSS